MADTKHPADALADWLAGMVCIHPQRSEDDPGGYATEYDEKVDEAQVMLRRIPALEAERDQLRAKLASVTDQADRAVAGCEQLRVEVEALRADGERYRWLRKSWHWEDERDMAPGGRWWVSVMVSEGRPTIDAAIDAARGKPAGTVGSNAT